MIKSLIIINARKVWVYSALIALIILLIGSGSWQLTSILATNLKEKIVVIDPGHGGADPGAQDAGLKEKDINLDIALRLSKELEAKGCKIILTRDVDKDFYLPGFVQGRMAKRIELNNRIKLATDNNADLFISVHTNSFPRRNSYGMETYYHLNSPSGKALAEQIQLQLTQLQKDNKRIAKAGDYYIINQTMMPSVIVEVGFLSNPRERKLLQSGSYRDSVAEAIATGIENFFKIFPQGVRESSTTCSLPDGPPPINGNIYKLYFSDENLEKLVSEDRQLNRSLWATLNLAQKATLVLNELIRGPHADQLTPTVSPRTKLLSLTVQNGLATINFSRDIQEDFQGGALEEDITLRSIVWAVTQIPGISGVSILINGEYGESIGGQILLDHPYTSQFGV